MSSVKDLEDHRKKAKELVELRNSALRLSNNRDFRKLILDYFCTEESARYAHASADPSLDATSRADALALAQAAGHLKRFLSVVVQMGHNAEREIVQIDEAIEEVRLGEDQGYDVEGEFDEVSD